VQSELGKGSTFTFSFRAPVVAGSRMVRPASEVGLGKINEPAAALPVLPEGTRILLAEDGPDNQRLIRALLRKAGAVVQVAENGLVAVRLVEQETFDLVLMDMAMPEMDGYTATRTLRDMGVELPILALTAHALSGERAKCLDAGCDDYLTKPIDRTELIARIAEHLRAKRD
jgi:CheY-like chemotaxis protein